MDTAFSKSIVRRQAKLDKKPCIGAGLGHHAPDQVWVVDITWIHLWHEDVYLAVILDVLNRSIRGWYLSRSLDHNLTHIALHRALLTHTPEIHHSDQGVQYAATDYTDLLRAHGVQISMADVSAALGRMATPND